MPRPISWLPRLNVIRRSVQNSVRSHYDRRDLELLFQVQPRSAGRLLKEFLPTTALGQAHLVERERLLEFLDRVREGSAAGQKPTLSWKKTRLLRRQDFDRISAVEVRRWMSCGDLRVQFESVEQLLDALWRIAGAMSEDLEEFLRLYEPPRAEARPDSQEREEIQKLFAELEAMEQARRLTKVQ